jgi:two-component system chemotaxis response regulator CheB
MPALRAVLVEDSTVQAAALVRMIEADGDIVVVGTAADAGGAADTVARLRPDVVTMDLDIPGGGHRAIEQIMAETPTPILVVSGVVESPSDVPAVRALAAGAVDALPKPRVWKDADATELRRQVRLVGQVPVIRRRPPRRRPGALHEGLPPRAGAATIIAIGASTGGPAAIASLLGGLTGCGASILLVQHIHAAFATGFASWLSHVCGAEVTMAEDGQRAVVGGVHVAPGDQHLRLGPDGRLIVTPEPDTLHRPSADELFRSVARHGGTGAVGVLLTGMGEDGAAGLLAMREAGARTFAQDEATSAVYGMPRAAQRLGAVEAVLPLDELPRAVRDALGRAR